MTPSVRFLTPRPKRALRTGDLLGFDGHIRLVEHTSPQLTRSARRRLKTTIDISGSGPGKNASSGAIDLVLRDDESTPEAPDAYRLEVGPTRIEIKASSASGFFYGVETLLQWIRLHESNADSQPFKLHGLIVDDQPAFERRGVLLDVSRNKVPTNETLLRLVDQLASWKINELQLYTEHTFAYQGHEAVWENWSPLTSEDIRELDEHCRERHIELVPNQQSLGHFHRWLTHDEYRHLAECPDGVEHPFSPVAEPFSLCPTDPAVLDLLSDLYGQLLPHFSSRMFNVGLDETFDIGDGRSADACAGEGKHSVYLGFLHAVHDLARQHGRTIQLWADIILEEPSLADRLPEDAIPLNWGYEADHPFAKETEKLAATGRDFYVCPGTSSWNSFAGRAHNALENLAAAAKHGLENGARGYLVTDWGDNGHLQPLSVSYLGFLAGAAHAWNPAPQDGTFEPWHLLLDRHAFGGRSAGLGRIAMALGNAYLATGTPSKNGSALFHLVVSPDDSLEHPRYAGLEQRGLEAVCASIVHARKNLESAEQVHNDTALEHETTRRELAWAADALELGARVGLARLAAGAPAPLKAIEGGERRELRSTAEKLVETLPGIWLARNRDGGLAESLGRLDRLLELLR